MHRNILMERDMCTGIVVVLRDKCVGFYFCTKIFLHRDICVERYMCAVLVVVHQ